MKKFLFLFLLLACNDSQNCDMRRSNGTPLQFYAIDEDSFNRESEGYTDKYCYSQKFLCTAQVRDQFIDENGGSDDYNLVVIDENEVEVLEIPYTKTLPLLLADLDDGDESGSGTSWVIDADPDVTVVGAGLSKIYRLPIQGAKANTDYDFSYDLFLSGALSSAGSIDVKIYDSAMTVLQTLNIPYGAGFQDFVDNINYTGGASVPAYIGVNFTNSAGTTSLRIDELSLTTEGTGITRYDVSFSAYDYDLCDQSLNFKIKKVFETDPVENPGFDTTIDPWLQDLTGSTWAMFGPSAIQATNPSKRLYQNIKCSNGTYTLTYANSRSISFGSCVVTFSTMDKDGNTLESIVIPNGSGTVSFDGYHLGVQVRRINIRAGGSFLGTVTIQNLNATATGEDEEFYYTDPYDFPSVWANGPASGKVEIQYRSAINFDNLIYDEDSPYFVIHLDGRFRKRKQVTTQKTLELTEKVINTAATLKNQKQLVLNDLSDIMHEKVNLILAHAVSGEVLVNGMSISVEEGYEEGDRPGTYPLTPATIFLTDRNFYKHNVT